MVCTQGAVHPQPSGCSREIYTQLAKCWKFDPSQRPEFSALELYFEEAASAASDPAASRQTAMNAIGPAGVDQAGYVVGNPRPADVSSSSEGYEMPTAENMQRLSQGVPSSGASSGGEGYEMPTAENMQRLSQGGGGPGPGPGDDDTEGYEMPTAENMRRIGGASSQPAGTNAVYNNIFDRDYDLASRSPAVDTGRGQPGKVQETAFSAESRDGELQDDMFKECADLDAVPAGSASGKRSKIKGGKIKKGGQHRISLTRHNSTSAMVANPLHRGTSA